MKKSWIVSRKNANNPLGRKPKYKTQAVNRCKRCGRPRGYIRYFGLCRICARELANSGLLPGIRRASW